MSEEKEYQGKFVDRDELSALAYLDMKADNETIRIAVSDVYMPAKMKLGEKVVVTGTPDEKNKMVLKVSKVVRKDKPRG